ncbi:MAG: hypothetical protein K2Y05_09260 [Hyphomicrobiaceae bacterium]|nr:hypothetical protein [Hyphomicrobiaceae bacterium]
MTWCSCAVAALALSVAATTAQQPAQAQPKSSPCPMTYAQFETAVAHVDLDTCPGDIAPAGSDRFCRATAGGEQVHVYAFEQAGDKCLAAMKSFDKDAFKLTIGK